MSQAKVKEREEVVDVVSELLKYEVIFLDYDRYRSKNHEKFDAIIHANENDYISVRHYYPLTTHPTKTNFWRVFKDIRMTMTNQESISARQFATYVNQKLQMLELDESYCQIWCMALSGDPVRFLRNLYSIFKLNIVNNQGQQVESFDFLPSFLG